MLISVSAYLAYAFLTVGIPWENPVERTLFLFLVVVWWPVIRWTVKAMIQFEKAFKEWIRR